jgi:hypothetical protein
MGEHLFKFDFDENKINYIINNEPESFIGKILIEKKKNNESIHIYHNIYRLGDLVLINNIDEEQTKLLLDIYPNSIGSKFILEKTNNNINYYYENPSKDISNETIKIITNIALKYANENINSLPIDINESVVIHLRLGDVIAGNVYHEKEKRPLETNYIKDVLKMNNDKKYIIGKCHYDFSVFNDYDKCNKLSYEYLNEVKNELNAIHLNSGNADIDLCCAIKCKLFVQGRGNYSKLIKLIRNYLNLETIECEEALKIDIK